jgi:hypothetical protein
MTEIEAIEEEQADITRADYERLRVEFEAYKGSAELNAKSAVRAEIRTEFVCALQALAESIDESDPQRAGVERALLVIGRI